MNIFTTMEISASGLTAQRQRLNVIAENLANAHTTRTPRGGPYLRKHVVLETRPAVEFASFLETADKVAVADIVESREGLRPEYDPNHPDADEQGMVLWPNVNPVVEMVSLTLASRGFEANVAVFQAARAMALKALEIGRG
ncbi:MAG: flagellar basal body rod protein FlgC [Deltaproteobacteria bacterium]|nr:flagellar basal body rod protein FlgC [Deltaproteobacteria bacterium]